MATLIDALVISLGLDASGFTKGQKQTAGSMKALREDASSTAKILDAQGKIAAEYFGRVRNAAVGMFAAFTAGRGIQQFAQQITATDAAVGRLSRNIEVGTEALTAWEGAAQRQGAAVGEVSSAFQGLQNQIQRFRLFGEALSPVFQNLGISLSDPITGAARDIEAIYSDVLDKLYARAPREREEIARSLGFGRETANLAALPRAERDKLLADQRRLGVVSPGQADNASRRQNAFLDADQAFTSLGRKIIDELTPAFVSLMEKIQAFAVYIGGPEFRPIWEALKEKIQGLVDFIGSNEFQSDMARLGKGIKDLGLTILEVLRFLGVLPRDEAAAAAGGAAPGAAPGPGMDRLGNRIAQDRAAAGPGWGELLWENAPTWMGGYGDGASPRAVQDRQREAFAFFTADGGYTPEQAAGIVANGHHESGLNPQVAPGDGGRSHGMFQWNGDRLARFQARHQGRLPGQATARENLEFARWELSEDGPEAAAGRAIRAARTAREAGQIASRRWLRPGATEDARIREERARGDTANNFLPALTAPPAAAGAPAPAAPPPRPLSYVDPGLAVGSRASMASVSNRVNNSTSSVENHVGQITVNTAATDAASIHAALGERIRQMGFADQATTALV